jgi:hypothetical protein
LAAVERIEPLPRHKYHYDKFIMHSL